MKHNLLICAQKLRLAPELLLANQTFVGVYFFSKNQGCGWGCLGFRFVLVVWVYGFGG